MVEDCRSLCWSASGLTDPSWAGSWGMAPVVWQQQMWPWEMSFGADPAVAAATWHGAEALSVELLSKGEPMRLELAAFTALTDLMEPPPGL